MSVFSRKKQKAENKLSTSGGQSFFIGSSSSAGTFVSENTAMQTAAVYACVRVISETIASLPLHVYRNETGGAVPAPEHRLYRLLHYAPSPEMTSFTFRETLMSHLLLYGNAYAQIIRDNGGRIIRLYPLLPYKMDVARGDDGELYYTYWRDRDEARPGQKDGGVALDNEDVLHFTGLSNDGLVGYSPIALARNTVGLAKATEEYGAGFFANSATPGGILECPGDTNKVTTETIRTAWEGLYKHNNGRVAVLSGGMKFSPVSIAPNDAQFLETRKFQLNEIARIFRVPPHMIGDLEKSSFSNIEQQSLEFVKYTISPWLVRLEQAMFLALLSEKEQEKYFIKFNLDGLLRGEYESRMRGYTMGINAGFMSPNDARRFEDWPLISPEKGGDDYHMNGAMKTLEALRLAEGFRALEVQGEKN
ncbi:MAG: phage portal protein [Desulfovibrio sp.]|jgi:HK97 family phage portal protein|nr:phage portal protein [Desulfovibrio sp.]